MENWYTKSQKVTLFRLKAVIAKAHVRCRNRSTIWSDSQFTEKVILGCEWLQRTTSIPSSKSTRWNQMTAKKIPNMECGSTIPLWNF